ncbi:cell number regulator 1-like [Syzygium oleosum]|uniref:cell number regulator 1-like n=1 Tax=Syzygium oleosum TaxID=219896 RepID=UPI0011D221F4|nr:cell number regulator 1-like [Syzygium oleosum]
MARLPSEAPPPPPSPGHHVPSQNHPYPLPPPSSPQPPPAALQVPYAPPSPDTVHQTGHQEVNVPTFTPPQQGNANIGAAMAYPQFNQPQANKIGGNFAAVQYHHDQFRQQTSHVVAPQSYNFAPASVYPSSAMAQNVAPASAASPYGNNAPNNMINLNNGSANNYMNMEQWTTGLFDCMQDSSNAFITALFPCITFGQIADVLDNGHTTCIISGIIYAFSHCILSRPYRAKLRWRFRLPEIPTSDYIVHSLFEPCALCQEYRELQKPRH